MTAKFNLEKFNKDYQVLATLPGGCYIAKIYGYDKELWNSRGELTVYFYLSDYDKLIQCGDSFITVDKIDRIPYKYNVNYNVNSGRDYDEVRKFCSVIRESTGYNLDDANVEEVRNLDDVYFGVILQEEEFKDDDGVIKSKLHLVNIVSTQVIKSGKYPTPVKIKYRDWGTAE